MSSNTLRSDSCITDVSIVSLARATTDRQMEEQDALPGASISLKREVKDDGSMTSDSSIPCAPSGDCSPYISPANSPEKKRSTALPASSSPACYEMTPTTRNTSSRQYNGRPMSTNFLPTVVSPDEGGPPREIGYFMEDGGVLSGQTSFFDHPDSSATNSLRQVNRHLQMPDKDSDNSTSAQKYLMGSASMARSRSLCCVPNTTPAQQQQPDASLLTDMCISTSQQQYWHDERQDEDNDSYMRDDDDYDTLAEDPSMNNYQYDEEEESQDHIGNIHFPPRKNNLSFHSLDEGGFRRAISSGNNPPLFIGRSPPSTSYLLEAYRPVRNDSLTEFGLRDSAVEAAAIFKDDDASSLYRPIPLKKGNSTGTHFSIPSIRLGAPLAFGDDNSSIRSAGDFGSEGWWNESLETMSDFGSVRGSFDEADGMSVTGKGTAAASRDRKQSVFDWLEDVKNQGSVEEAASSKFLREPTPLMASGYAPRRASTRFTPVVAVGGKPPRLDIRRSLFAPTAPRRSVSGSERARTFQAKEHQELHISF